MGCWCSRSLSPILVITPKLEQLDAMPRMMEILLLVLKSTLQLKG